MRTKTHPRFAPKVTLARSLSASLGCRITFFKPMKRTVTNDSTGEEQEKQFALLRTYTVFNVDQCEGEALDRFRVVEQHANEQTAPDFLPVEHFIQATGAVITNGGDRACYRRARFAEERKVIQGLPPVRLEAVKRLESRVDCGKPAASPKE